MLPPFLATDLDDVTLNWMGGMRKSRPGVQPCPKGPSSWDMAEWLGVEDARPLITEFNASPAFGRLEGFPCARAVLHAASARMPVYGITAASLDPLTQQRRRDNIDVEIGKNVFRDILFVDLGGDKTPHLQSLIDLYGRPGVWIEDNYFNALIGAKMGYTTFVVRRSHNRAQEAACSDTRLRWIDDLYPVADYLGLELDVAKNPSSAFS